MTRKSARPSGKALVAGAIAAAALSAEPLRNALANSPASPPAAVISQFQPARLAGEGELRFMGFRVYTARLWVGATAKTTADLLQQPLALELRYLRGLLGETIVEGSDKEIARLGFGDAAQRARWSAQMTRIFPNVKEGDRLTGTFDPARGVRFFFNDQQIGAIEDAEFGRAFMSIWLDERTQAPSLRLSVLQRLPTLARNP
jgi:hypothetical protein